jgi:hypothetical protein
VLIVAAVGRDDYIMFVTVPYNQTFREIAWRGPGAGRERDQALPSRISQAHHLLPRHAVASNG